MCCLVDRVIVEYCPSAMVVVDQIKEVVDKAQSAALWLDRRVSIIAGTFPKPIKHIIQAVFRSLPFIAFRCFLPGMLCIAANISVIAYRYATTPQGSTLTCTDMAQGTAFANLIIGCNNLAQGLIFQSQSKCLWGVIDLLTSALALGRTGFFTQLF